MHTLKDALSTDQIKAQIKNLKRELICLDLGHNNNICLGT